MTAASESPSTAGSSKDDLPASAGEADSGESEPASAESSSDSGEQDDTTKSTLASEGASSGHDREARASTLDASDAETLENELKRLRREIQRLQAELDRTPSPTWRQRHPVLTLLIITGLGAAAGYLGSKIGRADNGDQARKQLQDLTSRARSVLTQIQHPLEGTSKLPGIADETGSTPSSDVGQPSERTSSWFASNGAAASTPADVLDRVTRSARKARQSVQERARTATKDATERMVESVASDDDVMPAALKAKAAGLAATTVGGMLAKRLLRSAGRVAASMLLAYLGKKILDALRGR